MDEERRTPHNMQGLLHFCTSLTAKEDAPNTPSPAAMDPERREYLKNVLANLVVNMAKQTAGNLKTLSSSEELSDPEANTEAEEAALEDLVEIVQDVDNAKDLCNMGGYPVLLGCLRSCHDSIVALACEVLGAVCQNNPHCQDKLLKVEALDTILPLMEEKGKSLGVKVKALYAVSCLVRGHDEAMAAFDALDGFSFLMRAMQSRSDKLFVKAIFLIAHLIQEYQPAKSQLLSMGYTELLVEYLCAGDDSAQTAIDTHTSITSNLCREHCSSALLKLCSVSREARESCAGNVALTDQLANRLNNIKGGEEHQEEVDYITELLKLFENPSSPLEDTENESFLR